MADQPALPAHPAGLAGDLRGWPSWLGAAWPGRCWLPPAGAARARGTGGSWSAAWPAPPASRPGLAVAPFPPPLAITLALDAGAAPRDVQDHASHNDPRPTRRYDYARDSLDRNAAHAVAAYLAWPPRAGRAPKHAGTPATWRDRWQRSRRRPPRHPDLKTQRHSDFTFGPRAWADGEEQWKLADIGTEHHRGRRRSVGAAALRALVHLAVTGRRAGMPDGGTYVRRQLHGLRHRSHDGAGEVEAAVSRPCFRTSASSRFGRATTAPRLGRVP